jgi:hypothetical protein
MYRIINAEGKFGMVDAVKNSTHTTGTPTQHTPQGGMNTASTDPYDMSMFGFGNDYMGDITSKLSIYGPMAFNDRLMKTYDTGVRQMSNDFENTSKAEDGNLQPLAERIDEYRIGGVRIHHNEEVTETLEAAKHSGKGVALYMANCAEDGLKDSNGPISFGNLKNPLKLVDTLMTPFALKAPEANEDVKLLTEIAIKERSPEMAAAILQKTSEGGLLKIGTDYETAKKILADSAQHFESKEDHARFLTNIDEASEKMFGRSLDHHIHDEYKTKTQKLATAGTVGSGVLAGAASCKKLGKWGILGGAVIGAIAGKGVYSTHMFGVNEKGEGLLHSLDKARHVDNKVDLRKYGPFGSFTGVDTPEALPIM